MPKSHVEILQDRAIQALKSGGKPWNNAAASAYELLECTNKLTKKDDPRREARADELGDILDNSHPLLGQRWLSWATAVSTHEEGYPNRGHVLRQLATLRDTH